MRGIEQRIGLLTILLVFSSTVCGCVNQTYCIRRAALVPIPAPSQRPAALATGPIEGSFGNDTVLWARAPREADQRNIGLYVPRTQLQGNLLFSFGRYASFGLVGEVGLSQGALPISPNLIAPPTDPTWGVGVHLSFHIPIRDTFVIDIGCEGIFNSVPSHISYITCYPGDDDEPRESGDFFTNSLIFIPRLWIAFGADLSWSRVTAALGIRLHPTNVEVSREDHYSAAEISPQIDFETYPYVYLGWEFNLSRWAHLSVGLYQLLNFDPVVYTPIISASLRFNHVSESGRFTRRD